MEDIDASYELAVMKGLSPDEMEILARSRGYELNREGEVKDEQEKEAAEG